MNPNNDGIDHINIYSKGKTELGRFLSNFTRHPFVLPDGEFESIEGYWYWLTSDHPERDKLKEVYGREAKSLGRELRGDDWNCDGTFKRKILAAMMLKIESAPYHIQEAFLNNNLPLKHYYVYGDKVVKVNGAGWILDGWESIKRTLNDFV